MRGYSENEDRDVARVSQGDLRRIAMSGMLDPRAAAIDWAARSLAYETDAPSALFCRDRAENLVAIAEHYGVPDEALIAWIHTRTESKEWSAAEFRAWCKRYAGARNESEESWEASQALSDLRERLRDMQRRAGDCKSEILARLQDGEDPEDIAAVLRVDACEVRRLRDRCDLEDANAD